MKPTVEQTRRRLDNWQREEEKREAMSLGICLALAAGVQAACVWLIPWPYRALPVAVFILTASLAISALRTAVKP